MYVRRIGINKYREIMGINDMLMECSWNTNWDMMNVGSLGCHKPTINIMILGMIYGMGFTTVILMGVTWCDHIMNDFLT